MPNVHQKDSAADDHTARNSPVRVSILILTRNEECNIRDCLAKFSFTDDVVVLDSFSTDRTVEYARQFPNVRVFQRKFDTEFVQRNYGLHEVDYRHPWVYICDADERPTDELIDEIRRVVIDSNQPHAAYRLRYKNMYLGRWIKHATNYPVWIVRLVRPDLIEYEQRQTNVHPIVTGSIGQLNGHFLHFSFNAGLRRWFEKHNFYSDWEAAEGVALQNAHAKTELKQLLFAKDPMVRRRALKNLSFIMPARALLRFIYNYIFHRGFLDGMAGFHYCMMVAMYEYWISIKITEHRSHWLDETTACAKRQLARETS